MNSIRLDHPQCTHLLVVDFEATCGPGISKGSVEIIEVGAVLCPFEIDSLNVDTLPTFHSMIKPQLHPKITPFCTRLTGIRQQDVEQAPFFKECMHTWIAFLENHGCNPSALLFGSWSKFDWQQLNKEFERNKMDFPFEHCIDLQQRFKKHNEHRTVLSVKKALEALELEFEGVEHSALSDTKNTARLVPFAGW